ncbi:MAG TPA: electron transfer flavoprotein subunit alpha/FixB family protein [bacterium]|nr:electron transfer flavoprotein subunit alpha/FixB family protein [bacterium]HPS28780.1 electron transfer flavoprotein subunit alpha/FixB family protein [bacterium]
MVPSGLMVFCEVDINSTLKNISYELVSEGRRIADLTGGKVIAAVLCDEIADISELKKYGADEIIIAQRSLKGFFPLGSDTQTVSDIIRKYDPSIVFFGATDYGRMLAPKVAANLKCGITADCTGFEIDKTNRLVQIRPALGGNILAHIISPSSNPQMASVRPSVFKKEQYSGDRKNIIVTSWTESLSVADVIQVDRLSLEVKESDKIENAKVVVAIGMGIRSKEMISKFDEFAKSIGGVLACSRKVVEAGLMPHSRQVGQSGKTISPDIYIAVGISGAPQHLAGMKTSSKIIAVNSDRNAEIFSVADAGFVMDAGEWLKALNLLKKTVKNDNI